ncbi:serine/threonine-protein kinase [Streptomyces luomodiensis]|uniref:non-specific serine/threonine protein kinase n=1 Tax=Streptomyces luomodiensis TaxID=3026192 RepID=A0ABY9UXG2_9ACTN|nr:serine/threonine-protein kinase [Streptomyces sp. SCA4-21]WNE97193.1 serine/threonine-protein kinase [Streptomyces sp. SCA4-21]
MSDEGHLIAGRYRLVEKIGRGGMGTVWRAEDELLGRQVAVKQLHVSPHLAEDELTTLHERTRREARSAARITHPNVVVVHDVVDHGGLPCIVMEYVPSTTLADLLKDGGSISPDEAARIGRGMIAALRAAHAAGVLHRDVKPGNVLLGPDGRVVLTDFGIAMATGTSTLTKTGEVVGSIDYIAPERVRGRKPGPASDLWALGATLYQAVEGRAPFRRATAIETGYAIAVDPLDPPKQAGPLAALIERLLAKEPELRPSAEETERALRLPASEADTTSLPAPSLDSTTQTSRLDSTMNLSTRREPGTPPDRTTGTTANTPPHTPPHAPTASVSYPVMPAAPNTTQNTPPNTALPPPPGPAPAPPPPARKTNRKAVWTAVGASLAVVAVAGGVYVFGMDHDSGKDSGGQSSASGSPSASPTPAYTPPSGYHIVTEKKFGFSLPIPDGWSRQEKTDPDGNTVDSTQEVRYLDPTRMVGLRINVLDFASADQVQHFEEVETELKKAYPVYQRMRMQETKFLNMPAAVWEFKFRGSERMFRAIDLGFGKEGGKEYAIYLSAPDADWDTYRPVFDEVRDGFRILG